MVVAPTEIRTENFANTSLEKHRYASPLEGGANITNVKKRVKLSL
jgi:hypothetical protein